MTAAAHAALPRPQPLAAGPDSESAQVLAAQLDQEVAEQLRVDLRRAAELAAQARELARRHPERAIRAYALRARGNVLWFQGQHRRAAAAQARAAALFST
ncbi:MAG: hypothetical protein ACRD2F_12890, partial [Terriglobales bacterium]